MTHGLQILTRTLSAATAGSGKGYQHGNLWQYHPRSDRHSKVVCWAVVFDLLLRENLIRKHVDLGRIGIGINHEMTDFSNNRKKNLDLVVCKYLPQHLTRSSGTFSTMAASYGVVLTQEERSLLSSLPDVPVVGVQSALIALEAKAAMTEFGKARPRLYDELNSSHLTVHGDTDQAIAAGFVMINTAETFISPTRNHKKINSSRDAVVTKHNQPTEASLTKDKVTQLPRRSAPGSNGYDAIGVAMVSCANDGSTVALVSEPPAPQPGEPFYYDRFIERIETIYSTRFSQI